METKKKVTLQDIAARAGVSVSTVSRVLNNNALVADDTREAILAAIDALNYKPNLFAQGLVKGQSRTIGVLTQLLSSPFFDSILRGMMDCLNTTRYLPLFADGNWVSYKEKMTIEALLSRNIEGLIVLSGTLTDDYLVEVAQRVPLIVVAREIKALPNQCIFMDNVAAAAMATRYLIESGHRRIAHITGLLSHRDAIDRKTGYLQALAEAHLPENPDLLVEGDYTESSGVLAMEMLMTRGRSFSAVFAANDQMAYGARLALYRRGIRVPEDISIVGFDDQAPSSFMTPPLTTVRWPPFEIGRAAVQVLIQRIGGKFEPLPEFPPHLVFRESVARRRP